MAAKKKALKAKGAKAKTVAAGKTVKRAVPAAKAQPAGGPWGAVFSPRAKGERRYWLVKSEPEVFSFDDLLAAPARTTCWDGVRNYAARNFMRDGMKKGDMAFYYHSNADPQVIAGICEVVREGYADHTATTRGHDHFDPDSDAANPTWMMVDMRAVAKIPQPVSLKAIKARADLATMALIRVSRLSVVPVTAAEWRTICMMGGVRGE